MTSADNTLFTVYIARVLAHNLYRENFMSFFRTEDLEGMETAVRRNFVRIERHGVVVEDHSHYLNLHGKIINYVIFNAHYVIARYNIPPTENYWNMANFIINAELNRRIQ